MTTKRAVLVLGVIALVVVVAVSVVALGVFLLIRHRSALSDRDGKTATPVIAVQPPAVSPEPDVALDINRASELAVYQGAPLRLTVRLANKRAFNAQSANEARQAVAAGARELFKAGKITAAEVQALESSGRQTEKVPTLILPAEWPRSIHLQVRRADDPAVQPDWPVSLVVASDKGALLLDATRTIEATWALSPEAAVSLAPGAWQVTAILDTTASATGEAWRGKVASQPVSLTVKPRPASLALADAEREALEGARYFAATAQWDQSLAEARRAAGLNADSVDAHILIGDALLGRDDKQGAMKAYRAAMAAFRKKHKGSREIPEYLVWRIHQLLLESPPEGIAPPGTQALPPPKK